MPKLRILSDSEISEFQNPPKLSKQEKEYFFDINSIISNELDIIKNDINKVYFVLMSGYFKICHRFFDPESFYKEDIDFVADLLGISLSFCDDNNHVNMIKKYKHKIFYLHKEKISNLFGFKQFDNNIKINLESEAMRLVAKQLYPKLIFSDLLLYLGNMKIEIPDYNILLFCITNCFNKFEKELLCDIDNSIEVEEKILLNSLIEDNSVSDDNKPNDSKDNKNSNDDKKTKNKAIHYRIMLLKKINQSLRPAKIKASINNFTEVKNIYKKIECLIKKLNLSPEALQYYAVWVLKARSFQILQFPNSNKRYLYLVSFICYQYYSHIDTFIDIALKSVQNILNLTDKNHQSEYFNDKKSRNKIIKKIFKDRTSYKEAVKKASNILKSNNVSQADRINQTLILLEKALATDLLDKNDLNHIEKNTSSASKDIDYYNILESNSVKLQNRISAIIKHVEFNKDESDKLLIEAIDYYKKTNGVIDQKAPIEFLTKEQKSYIYNKDKNKKIRISLYKAFLFINIADSIKAGTINLKNSFKYLSIEEYLIAKAIWDKDRKNLIKKAGLTEFMDYDNIMKILSSSLHKQYNFTNKNLISGQNQLIKITKDGKAIVSTPKVDKPETLGMSELFPKNDYVSVTKILSDINNVTNFTDLFEHYNIKNNKNIPSKETFYGGIIGYGCNYGATKVAKLSKGISPNRLRNTLTWYFQLANIEAANNRIASYINKLDLSNIFAKNQKMPHSSGDGQKFTVCVDSLNANASFKYSGNDKALSVYSFINEKHILFHSTVLSSSDREAAYVIDGLQNNNEIETKIFSTDTHGYTESIFAVTHMMGISFAPRIKNYKNQTLYSFKRQISAINTYKSKNYEILPNKYINEKIIKDNWDDILRLVVTIKLKETSASQIFKRLSSYAKLNPLHKALKEFGRIIKSIFLLQYLDNLELRQSVEKQLNKVELSHKFAKAVYYGNSQEFQYEGKGMQNIVAGCKRLIQNSIILWNYLYLTQLLMATKDINKKQQMLKIIQMGSIIAWQHINLHGTYDFTPTSSKNSQTFNLKSILMFKLDRYMDEVKIG